MSAVKVQFEIGHEASIRTKKTANGFTHDWEVFVRGQEGADISHFVEKVVFNLHETFTKPKRVVREPPYSVKESGYAGFNLVIEIYVKNKEEPKKIRFYYDLSLPQSGPATYNFLKDRFVFHNPNEEFKKKLLKGGGIVINNNTFYTNPDQETRSRDSVSEERHVVVSKPKMNTVESKKYKKDHKDDTPHKTSSFENLFGPPIQKPKISPDPKKSEKKIEKRPNIVEKPKKHEEKHKESKSEKTKAKDGRDKPKPEKSNKNVKDSDRPKDKTSKRPSDRVLSPEPTKKRCTSPSRRPSPSPARSSSSLSIKEDPRPPKTTKCDEKEATTSKPPEVKIDKEVKEKKKKEKKSHTDRDKERKERKEHKKDNPKLVRESPKDHLKETPKESPSKVRELPKEKETFKETPKPAKPTPEKALTKPSADKLLKTPQDYNDRFEEQKPKEKVEPERKHKHKKKDKKRDESREKHKESKEKRHKHEKREVEKTQPEIVEQRETPVAKERLALPEPTSPISLDTVSQCSSNKHVAIDDNSGRSDSEMSVIMDEEDKNKPASAPPEPPATSPETEVIADPPPPPQQKEKVKKHKDKSSKREEKKRKRKAAEDEMETRKLPKIDTPTGKAESDIGEGSNSTAETKLQDNGVSSSLGEDAESGELSPNYMVQLRELQQRIMTIKSNEDLERVVNLIAETGRYEVTTQTFDFDLCQLDRSTVQQLIQLVGC